MQKRPRYAVFRYFTEDVADFENKQIDKVNFHKKCLSTTCLVLCGNVIASSLSFELEPLAFSGSKQVGNFRCHSGFFKVF